MKGAAMGSRFGPASIWDDLPAMPLHGEDANRVDEPRYKDE